MENEYSNREIDTLFKVIDTKLDLIHEQTLKTNGRVTCLEDKVGTLQVWQATIKGGLLFISFTLLPIAIYQLNQFLHSR